MRSFASSLFFGSALSATATLNTYDTNGKVLESAETDFSAGENFELKVWLGTNKKHLEKVELQTSDVAASCRIDITKDKWKQPAILTENFTPCMWPERSVTDGMVGSFDVRDIPEFHSEAWLIFMCTADQSSGGPDMDCDKEKTQLDNYEVR
jgi:hypothetical protein